ncbi:hypothetical protein P4S68_14085 [Pseudoalteromonas sp. Hal099]
MSFIQKYGPKDQQVIFSIADSRSNKNSALSYNNQYFEGKAKLICIGENTRTRSFLKDYNGEFEEYLTETLTFLE